MLMSDLHQEKFLFATKKRKNVKKIKGNFKKNKVIELNITKKLRVKPLVLRPGKSDSMKPKVMEKVF